MAPDNHATCTRHKHLYSSTGTGLANDALDPITINEWWMLAQADVLETAKRGVPGVWTYGFYDGWVPNYMFFIAHSHNAIGRFYEVQSYGPDNYEVRPGANVTGKEWFRPSPPLPQIKWGPRNNTNIQQSAILFSMQRREEPRALSRELLAEEQAVGRQGPQWADTRLGDPRCAAPQSRRRRRGQQPDAAGPRSASREFGLPRGQRGRGCACVVRGDQPFRTLAEMCLGAELPRRTRDSRRLVGRFVHRNLTITPITDKTVLDQPMTIIAGP